MDKVKEETATSPSWKKERYDMTEQRKTLRT